MRTRLALISVALLASLTVAVLPASAEWFGDLYLGAAFTQNNDVTAKGTVSGTPFEVTGKDIHFDNSVAGGGRFGYWFNAVPWLGLGLDVSHFQPKISSQTIDTTVTVGGVTVDVGPLHFDNVKLSVTDISFDLMLRWPGLMASPQFPKGQLQPYVSLGPAIFIATAKDSTNFGPPNNQSNTDTSVGVQVGGGVTWLFTQNIGIFGEYRFTHFRPEFEFTTALPGFSKSTVNTDVNTHYLIVGVTFRF